MPDDAAPAGPERDGAAPARQPSLGRRQPAAVLVTLSDRRGWLLVRMPDEADEAATRPEPCSFPGGALGPGESAADAACRRLTEEAGLLPAQVPPLTEVARVSPEPDEVVAVLAGTTELTDAPEGPAVERRRTRFLDPRTLPPRPLTLATVLALPHVLTSTAYVAAHGRTAPRGFAGMLVVDRGGRILLQERDEHAAIDPERWGLPGGHLEDGEDPREGALRELVEETGLHMTADQVEHLVTVPVYHPHRAAVDSMAVFLARTGASDDELVCGEGRQVAFVGAQDAVGLDLTFSARTVLPAFLGSPRYRRMCP